MAPTALLDVCQEMTRKGTLPVTALERLSATAATQMCQPTALHVYQLRDAVS